MEIGFCDSNLRAAFNSYRRLETQFGAEVAKTIATRMAVLSAAPRLSAVPQKPPINLRSDEDCFSVQLTNSKRLRFHGMNEGAVTLALHLVSEIQIIGVGE